MVANGYIGSPAGDNRFISTAIGPVTVTLPTPVAGQPPIYVVKTSNDTNAVTIVATGGVLINGAASVTLTVGLTGATFITDGHQYYERR